MICPICGHGLVGITESNGYSYYECENCGFREEDPVLNAEYNDELRYR